MGSQYMHLPANERSPLIDCFKWEGGGPFDFSIYVHFSICAKFDVVVL